MLSYLFFLIKLTEIIKIQSSVKSIGKCKKKSLYNQPKPYFFQKIIVKSFLDRFLQMLHQKHWELSIFWLVIYIHPYLTCVLTMNLKTTLLASIIRPMYVKIELKHKNQGIGIISTSFVNESISEVMVTFLNVIWFFNIHTINYILNYM